MRIEDEDILRIIKQDGPSVSGYIGQRLNIQNENDRKKLSHKLSMLAKYGYVERVAKGRLYIYRFPGDNRPVNMLAMSCETARDKFNEHIGEMSPGDTLTCREVQDMTGCNEKWARRLLHSSGLIPVSPRPYREPTLWTKGASQ